jgi:monoamine oxidase
VRQSASKSVASRDGLGVVLAVVILVGSLGSASCRGRPARSAEPAASALAPAGRSIDARPGAPRVIVVGGGVAGLVSAYELGKRGVAVAVLEASDVWGGRVATARYGDDTYAEYGMQELWAGSPLLRIARELGVPLDEKVERSYSSVVLGGQLVPFVQSTPKKFLASFLNARERRALEAWMAQAAALHQRAEAVVSPAPDAPSAAPLPTDLERLQSISFGDWVAEARLPKRASEWLRLTLECEVGTDWKGFSGLSGLLELGAFLGDGEPNYHVRGGNARLVEALAGSVPGPKTLSATVTAVERWTDAEGKTRVRVSSLRGGRIETQEAERVIVAVPFYRLHQIRFEPPLSEAKWQGVLTLGRGQYTVVHLLLDKEARAIWAPRGARSPFPVLTDGDLGVVYGVMHPTSAREPLEVFSLLVHGAAAGAFHMIPRELKVRQLVGALERFWPGLGAHVHSSQVFTYHPAAIPVWPPGRSPLDAASRALRVPELGLVLAGDYLVGAHADAAARSGEWAAARVAEDLTAPPTLGAATRAPVPPGAPSP